MAKTNIKPAKGNGKTVKGGHYTPPTASKDLPPSYHKPLSDKGRKKGAIADD